jgi:hypothetical protein
MSLYDILWLDGNVPEWEYSDSWYTDWYKPHTCHACGSRSLDLRSNVTIQFEAKSTPKSVNLVDIVGNLVALTIVHIDLYRAIQEALERSFHVGPVSINGEPDPTHIACVARYEARMLFEGSIATEIFHPCTQCGRFFQNTIGRRFAKKSSIPSFDIVSDCSGLALVANDKTIQSIPQHVAAKCHFKKIESKE